MHMSTITRTDRLILIPLTIANIDEAHKVYSDPRIWEHRPKARHEDVHTTRLMAEAAGNSWATHGYGPWAAYLRDQPSEFIGVGGAIYAEDVWDIKTRLRPAHWGQGYASEIAQAAVDFLKRKDADTPITARITTNQAVAARVMEKIGLAQIWEGRRVDTEGDSSEPDVRVYADRNLSAETLERIQARP